MGVLYLGRRVGPAGFSRPVAIKVIHEHLAQNKRFARMFIAKARQHGGGQTKTGSLRGKIAYMPPEQARSARTVDRRADLYCVGLVLWEMLTGRRLFQGKNEIEVLNLIRNPVIIPPSAVAH